MSIKIIEYKNNKILEVNYADRISEESKLELLEESVRELIRLKEPIKALTNYAGSPPAGRKYMNRIKELSSTIFEQHLICSAVLGIHGFKKVLFKGYKMATNTPNTAAFNSREEALEWIANYNS